MEHDWKQDIRSNSPVLVCSKCYKVWWPDQKKPTSKCKGKS